MSKTLGMAPQRRRDRRYALQLDLRWKLVRRRRVLETGTGYTLDLSSSGILLDVGRHLPAGLNLELSVSWPVLHQNVSPLHLSVLGRIVRTDGHLAAIQMVQHELRTAGMDADLQGAPAGVSSGSGQPAGEALAISGSGKPSKPKKL
jgi:hypothetical protein